VPRTDDPRTLLDEAEAVAGRIAPTLTVNTELVEGNPLTALLRVARHAALTVIGDGNLNNVVCLPADTLAVQFTARAASAVMITRAAPPPDGPVLSGVTDYATSDQVLTFAFDEAAYRQTSLVVVHVCETENETDALEELVASRARAYGVETCFRRLEGDPATVVPQESREAALIVVGARGRLPYHGMLGSVTQRLLHHGRAPIDVVRGVLSEPRRGTRIDPFTTPAPVRRPRVSAAVIPPPAQQSTAK
jgi:nucleotide-binding universal stress UspA family protein